MRRLLALGLCLAVCGLARADEKKTSEIKGVNGAFVRVEFDHSTAGKAQSIKIPVGGKIEIEYTYPIAPPFPDGVGGKSSDAGVVKYEEANAVRVYPLRFGVGRLGTLFRAEAKGKATLTMEVQSGGQGVILKVDVEVH